jgi:hypothetical protein
MQRYKTFLNGAWRLVVSIFQSTGVSDGGKIVSTDPATGKLHASLLPSGLGTATKVYPASEDLVAGNFINIWLDTATLRVRKADSSNGRRANGFVLDAVTSGATATVILQGLNTALTALDPTQIYYLGTNGGITTNPPTANNAIIQDLGYATATGELNFEFNTPVLVQI